jgi:hypothetical protein
MKICPAVIKLKHATCPDLYVLISCECVLTTIVIVTYTTVARQRQRNETTVVAIQRPANYQQTSGVLCEVCVEANLSYCLLMFTDHDSVLLRL